MTTDLHDIFTPPADSAPAIAERQWQLIGGDSRFGSWSRGTNQDRARALVTFKGELYAGIGAASADVWRFDGEAWQRIGGGGVNGSWDAPGDNTVVGHRPELRWVNALSADADDAYLYAGVKSARGAQVWRFDGSTWQCVGGAGDSGDWRSDRYDHVYTLAWHGGQLYAGLQGFLSPNDDYDVAQGNGEIYRFDGSVWQRVAGEGINNSWDRSSATMWVYELCSIGDDLYAAIGRQGVRGNRHIGEVWRFADERWTHIGGEGARGSWQPQGVSLVTSLVNYQGNLVAGFNTPARALRDGAFGNVWTWNPRSEQWCELSQPVVDADAQLVNDQTMFNISRVDRGRLVVGGGSPHLSGRLAAWTLDVADNVWRCLAHPGMPRFTSPGDAECWNAGHYFYSMTHFDDDLIFGVKGPEGTAHVWRCRV